MTALIRPDAARYDEWSAMVREFGGSYPPGSGLPQPHPGYDRDDFAASLTRAQRMADASLPLPPGLVHEDAYWIADDSGLLVGFAAVRHRLTARLRASGGHIGYSVRPSRRREGHAGRALGRALARAGEIGIRQALLTCAEANLASARTIESRGGRLEDVRGGTRRYWIEVEAALSASASSPR